MRGLSWSTSLPKLALVAEPRMIFISQNSQFAGAATFSLPSTLSGVCYPKGGLVTWLKLYTCSVHSLRFFSLCQLLHSTPQKSLYSLISLNKCTTYPRRFLSPCDQGPLPRNRAYAEVHSTTFRVFHTITLVVLFSLLLFIVLSYVLLLS